MIVGQERHSEYARLIAVMEDVFRCLQSAMDAGNVTLMRQQRSRLAALRDDLAAWRAGAGGSGSAAGAAPLHEDGSLADRGAAE